jgi:hypothetical protein
MFCAKKVTKLPDLTVMNENLTIWLQNLETHKDLGVEKYSGVKKRGVKHPGVEVTKIILTKVSDF